MPIVLPFPLTTLEMRVLQEYRRIGAESLNLDAIKAIKHPAGGGEAPALSLVEKGYLATVDRQGFSLTDKAKDFLVIDAKPEAESGSVASTAGD